MTTVYANQTVVGLVPVGSQITVTNASGASTVVRRIYGGNVLDTTTVGSGGTQTFGPYLVEMSLQISCVTGSCEFTDARVTDAVTGGAGGGAAAFTDLEDAPGAITPSGVVVGNDAGNGLRMSDVIYITESDDVEIDTTASDAGLSIRANGTAGMSVEATGSGGLTLDASGDGQLYIDVSGPNGLDIHNLGAGRTRIQGGDNGLVLEPKTGAALEVNNVTDVGSAAIPATRDAVLRITCDGVEYLIPLIAAA